MFVLILGACSTSPKLPEPRFSTNAQEQLYQLDDWKLDGRLAITVPDDSWTAGIEWRHETETDRVKFSGPLGQGGIAIELQDNMVKIDRGAGNIQTSTQPNQFVNQQLGIYVPIQSLRYWAIGLPEQGEPYQSTNDGFVQDGWLVTYKEMQKTRFGNMPKKMTVTNAQVKLKLIVDQWTFDEGQPE